MPKLLPSRTKYRKVFKGRVRGTASKGNKVSFGEFGIQSLSRGRMTSNQIEAARVSINRHLKRKGKVWIRVFPHKPVTKKPAETRQGKGKGPVDHWVAVVKPGHVLFEISGEANLNRATNLMNQAIAIQIQQFGVANAHSTHLLAEIEAKQRRK